ncbi:MAG: hypothetical protein ACOYOU_00490 [Kiritimatiellia bacterium]
MTHLSNIRSASLLLVAEDALGLALGRRLVQEHDTLSVWREINARGFSAIKQDITKYNNLARNGVPVLILTDLDSRACCRLLMDEWFGGRPALDRNMLLRICVREAEAWLMADPDPLARLLRLPIKRFPSCPEQLPDPKLCLLNLARKAPAKIRNGLLPERESTARIGPRYNELLLPLLAAWNIDQAAKSAPSLAKARHRIGELAQRVRDGGCT